MIIKLYETPCNLSKCHESEHVTWMPYVSIIISKAISLVLMQFCAGVSIVMGCDAMWTRRLVGTFWKNISPSSQDASREDGDIMRKFDRQRGWLSSVLLVLFRLRTFFEFKNGRSEWTRCCSTLCTLCVISLLSAAFSVLWDCLPREFVTQTWTPTKILRTRRLCSATLKFKYRLTSVFLTYNDMNHENNFKLNLALFEIRLSQARNHLWAPLHWVFTIYFPFRISDLTEMDNTWESGTDSLFLLRPSPRSLSAL
jgi:hypothetical protein